MPQQVVQPRTLSAALSECAKAMERGAEEYSVAVTEAIDRAIEDFDHTRAVTAHTLAATRSSFHAFCALIRVDEPLDFDAPPEAAANARAYVRRGIPLRVLVRCYQVGHGEMWRVWHDVVRARDLPADVEREVLTHGSNVLFHFIERVTANVMDVYEREQKQWSRSMEAIREETVKGILDDAPFDLEDAQRALAYDLRAVQVGIVLWTADGRDRREALHETWQAYVAAANGHSATAIAVGSRATWGWIAARGDELEGRFPDPDGWQPLDGIHMAIGEPERGPDGFRASHYQAMQARRVSELGHSADRVVRFGDLAVEALVTADMKLAKTFALRQLGPLGGTDKLAARLRTTLEAYFAERESPGAAARRLNVHVNTVIYRLKQAEELLGVVPSDRRRELELALMLFRYITASDRAR